MKKKVTRTLMMQGPGIRLSVSVDFATEPYIDEADAKQQTDATMRHFQEQLTLFLANTDGKQNRGNTSWYVQDLGGSVK